MEKKDLETTISLTDKKPKESPTFLNNRRWNNQVDNFILLFVKLGGLFPLI